MPADFSPCVCLLECKYCPSFVLFTVYWSLLLYLSSPGCMFSYLFILFTACWPLLCSVSVCQDVGITQCLFICYLLTNCFCLPLTRMWVLPFICLCYLLNFIFLCFCMIACEFFLLFVLFAVCWSLFACQDVSAVLCLSYLLFAVYWPPLLCLCLPPYRCCSLFCSLPADHFIALLASLWVLAFIHLVCLLIFVFAYQYVSATPLLSADLYITLFLLARMQVVTLVHHICCLLTSVLFYLCLSACEYCFD